MLKAISLWEPWATGMAIGFKTNETRSWPTNYRGDLAICSARRKLTQAELDVARNNNIPVMALKFGFVLCVVELYQCLPSEHFQSRDGKPSLEYADFMEMNLGDYSPGRFIWRTRNLCRLNDLVPVIGRQGFFNLPPDVEEKVRNQI